MTFLSKKQLIDLYSVIANHDKIDFINCKALLDFLNICLIDEEYNQKRILEEITLLLLDEYQEDIRNNLPEDYFEIISYNQINSNKVFFFSIELLNIYSLTTFRRFDSKDELKQVLVLYFAGNINNNMLRILTYYYETYRQNLNCNDTKSLNQIQNDLIKICEIYEDYEKDRTNKLKKEGLKTKTTDTISAIQNIQDQLHLYFGTPNKEEFMQDLKNWQIEEELENREY